MIHLIGALIGLYMSLVGHDPFDCKVTNLESYGFSQISKYDEYVCYNKNDYTDFVVIEDTRGAVAIDDTLSVTLDDSNNVVRYKVNSK